MALRRTVTAVVALSAAMAGLVAGVVADAQQGQARPFGFIDPAIYTISKTPAIHDALPMTARTPVNDRQGVCDAFYCGILYVTDFDTTSTATTARSRCPATTT